MSHIMRSVFQKAIMLAGDPKDNPLADLVLVGMALRNKLSRQHTVPAAAIESDIPHYKETLPSLYTTNMNVIEGGQLGFNPIICFPGAGGFRHSNVYTATGVYMRDVIAYKIAEIIEKDLGSHAPEAAGADAQGDTHQISELKQAIKDRMSHPALQPFTMHDIARLSAPRAAQIAELLAAQKRIVCYGYSAQSPEEDVQAANARVNPDYACAEAHIFVRDTFVPRMTRQDEDGEMTLLDPEELARNMRMTLVGYSYGGFFITQTLNALTETMRDMGYDGDTITHALSNIHVHNMQGSNGLEHKFPTSNISIHDKNDLLTLSGVDYEGYYPWRLQFRSQRLDPNNKNVVINGPNSLLVWSDLPIPDTLPKPVLDNINAKVAPRAIGYHFATIEQPEKLPVEACNALICSIIESKKMPPVTQSVRYDTDSFVPSRVYGTDRSGFPLFIDDIIQAVQRVPELTDQVADYLQAQDTVKMNKAVSDLSKAMVTVLKEAGIDISRKSASSAAQIQIIRAKENAGHTGAEGAHFDLA